MAERFPGGGDAEAELRRVSHLVQDTAELPIDVLKLALRAGVKVWRFMPTAAEVLAEAKFFRDMAKREPLRLPPPPPPARKTPEQEAAWDEQVAQLFREMAAAPGPITPFTAKATAPARDWSKPPEHSDLSPELKALAIERGWVRAPVAV